MEKVVRNLDGFYLRVERDGKWVNRCFTDLTFANCVENRQICLRCRGNFRHRSQTGE